MSQFLSRDKIWENWEKFVFTKSKPKSCISVKFLLSSPGRASNDSRQCSKCKLAMFGIFVKRNLMQIHTRVETFHKNGIKCHFFVTFTVNFSIFVNLWNDIYCWEIGRPYCGSQKLSYLFTTMTFLARFLVSNQIMITYTILDNYKNNVVINIFLVYSIYLKS